MFPGMPKADWAGIAVRVVNSLERIADALELEEEEEFDSPVQNAVNPDEVVKLRRELARIATELNKQSGALHSILDDDQTIFEKAKRLRLFADAVQATAEDLRSKYGQDEGPKGQAGIGQAVRKGS
jgi:ribosomal protein L29